MKTFVQVGRWLSFVLPVVLLGAGIAHAQFDDLVSKVPVDTNTLILLNTEKILASPTAVKEDWKGKIKHAHEAGLTLIQPSNKQAVLAAELDFDFGAPLWQLMIGRRDQVPDLASIAKKVNGSTDAINGFSAVALPMDGYIVRFSKEIAAFITPGNRQFVSRWLKTLDAGSSKLSPYLTEAYSYAQDLGTPLIMAIDLSDVATPEGIRARLAERWPDSGFEGKAKLEDVADVLASIRGVTLGVTFTNGPFGSLKVDFGKDVAPIAPIAKELLLHVLHTRGIFINEFEDWELAAKGNNFRISGKLTDSGLRRLMSPFDAPPGLLDHAEESNPNQPPKSEKDIMLEKSLSYYQSVNALYKDLKTEPSRQGNNYTAGSIAGWYDNYARKIDNLPILNVDPYLVEFGAQTAQALRQASSAIKTGGVQSKTAQLNAPKIYNTYSGGQTYGYTYRSDWYGSGYVPYGTSWQANIRDQREETAQAARIRTEYRNKSIFSAREIVDGIAASLADVRRQMTQKYQVEFK